MLGLLTITILLMYGQINTKLGVIEDKITFINDDSLYTINEGLGDINNNIVTSDLNDKDRYNNLATLCGE